MGPRRRLGGVLGGLGLGGAVGALMVALMLAGVFEPAERLAVDGLQRAAADPTRAADDILLVAIDQGSLEMVEEIQRLRFPWPRAVFGDVLAYIHRGGPKGILLDLSLQSTDHSDDEVRGTESDAHFVQALSGAGKVTLGVTLRPPDPTPASERSQALLRRMALPARAEGPLPAFARADPLAWAILSSTARFGFTNAVVDEDGLVRRAALLARVGDQLVPALSLATVLDEDMLERLSVEPGELRLGELRVPVDDQGLAWIRFHGQGGVEDGRGRTYPYLPIVNLLISIANTDHGVAPPVPPETFRDKWVVIGATSPDLFDLRATPFSHEGTFPGMEIHAAVLDNLLHGGFFSRIPRWGAALLVLLVCLICALAELAVQRLYWSAVIAGGTAAGHLAAVVGFHRAGVVVDLVVVEVGLLVTLAVTAYANFLVERRSKRQIRNLFQHYLDPGVVRRLLESSTTLKLGGEKRVCTASFADIAGFTGLSEQLEPERLVEVINRFLGGMTEVVLQHGGFVDKYIGDAVMAVFGAPMDLPGHAAAGCRAALGCQRKAEELRLVLRPLGVPELRVRVGVNSGPMIVGNMGSERRMNYTVMGDAVNLASRLEGVNKDFGTAIIVGPETRRLAGEEFVFRELDRLRVKGKQEPVEVYELVGAARDVPQRLHDHLELFERGRRAFFERRFEEARALFEQLHGLWTEDVPTRTYLQRCLTFQAAPPAQTWDGVSSMQHK
ncbi:MAG TPA: adenylate/guanylate cyclase domain-containing protein [Myxococcota bacterium]|nr:adenylate/guanylate cyclase domain-containing protein [Myxococcota bacterium]